ncbi:MAG: UDP-N-acetylmuramoyl-L-alanyl-D-glutamate--2,6-diaminopimelate ligase [Gammaproteobacteria bacterium]
MTAIKQGEIYLSELTQGIAKLDSEQNVLITGLELDSRKVKPGNVFFALNGTASNGLDFINDAISKGAIAIFVDSNDADLVKDQISANIIFVGNLISKVGLISHRYFGNSTDEMKVFGVTGTNGKTSVSHFIGQAIDQISGARTSGVIGTLGNGFLGEFVSSGMTTPDVISLHKSLSRLNDYGAKATVIEASSHGLSQQRLNGVKFNVAVFTNLTRDHLDYHGNMKAYGDAKLCLFKSQNLQAAVVNLDDPFSEQILDTLTQDQLNKIEIIGFTFSEKNYPEINTIRCKKLDISVEGLEIEIDTPQGTGVIKTDLLGRFNASNLLAALGSLLAAGYEFKAAIKALSEVTGVPGRMEAFIQKSQPAVVVDFAHTPDGLESALSTLKELCVGKLWCVFGCGGDRDKGKRSLMGKVAEKLSDSIIITNDNPRSEDPEMIADQILAGIKNSDRANVIFDRKQAIEFAINSVQQNDIVLIAGKGHEEWQEVNGQRFPFNDRNIVLNILNTQQAEGDK